MFQVEICAWKGIVEAHHGDKAVENEVDGRSRVDMPGRLHALKHLDAECHGEVEPRNDDQL